MLDLPLLNRTHQRHLPRTNHVEDLLNLRRQTAWLVRIHQRIVRMRHRLEKAGILLREPNDLLEMRLKRRIPRLHPCFFPRLVSSRRDVRVFFNVLAGNAHRAAVVLGGHFHQPRRLRVGRQRFHLSRRVLESVPKLGRCELLVGDALDRGGHVAVHRHAAGRHRHMLVPSNQRRRVPQVDDVADEYGRAAQWRSICRSCAIGRQLAAEGLVGAITQHVVGLHQLVNLASALVDDRAFRVSVDSGRRDTRPSTRSRRESARRPTPHARMRRWKTISQGRFPSYCADLRSSATPIAATTASKPDNRIPSARSFP